MEKKADGHDLEDGCGELARQQNGHPVVDHDTGTDFAGVSLGKEDVGQPQHVVQELGGTGYGKLDLLPEQVVLLKPGQYPVQSQRHRHPDQERFQPAGILPHEDVVHENLRENRNHQPRDHQDKAREDGKGESLPDGPEPFAQRTEHAEPGAAFRELGTGLNGKDDAGEGLIQLFKGNGPPAEGRIVEVDLLPPDGVEHHKVIKIPE